MTCILAIKNPVSHARRSTAIGGTQSIDGGRTQMVEKTTAIS